MLSKSQLAIVLSRLEGFKQPDVRLEQYQTPSEIAADILWNAYLQGDLKGKWADLACGPGILGLGALIMGAEKVYFVDIDEEVLKTAKNNLEMLKSEGYELGKALFIKKRMSDFNERVDVLIQNPPFGTRKEHADKGFLETAFKLSTTIYTMHKSSTSRFIEKFSDDNKFKITHCWNYDFQLKATMQHHTKRIETIKVSCFRIIKKAL